MNPLTQKVLGVSCSGLECTHELGEKHWVVTEDDIAKIHTLIREETVKECIERLKDLKKPRCRCMCEANNEAYRYNLIIDQAIQAL